MKDYTIGESYVLPSLGKVYSKEINPEFKMRSMTTVEEMKRMASNGDLPYKNMSEIIDDCIVEGIGMSSYDLCVGDYQYLLHKLRIVTYGPEYPIVNNCYYCGCETEDVINLEDLPVLKYNEEFEKYREFDLPVSKTHIRLRVQTPHMLDNISVKTKDFKRKYGNTVTYDPTLQFLIEELIEAVDGNRPNPVKIGEWIKGLAMADTNTIIQYADRMNSIIGVDTNLTCICNVCGLDFKTTLKTTQEFFRPSLRF